MTVLRRYPVNSDKAKVLFVDDEPRVLNSMRVMFRRDFELFLAPGGEEALAILRDHDIDVIVSDHRMPTMTGVELLSAARTQSPRSLRILLTGYADLDAVEGSINSGEVFRFLTKPCPPDELRNSVLLAARIARDTPEHPDLPVLTETATDPGETLPPTQVEVVLEGDTATVNTLEERPAEGGLPQQGVAQEPTPVEDREDLTETDVFDPDHPDIAALKAPADTPGTAAEGEHTGIAVLSVDGSLVEVVTGAVSAALPVYSCGTIVQLVKTLSEHQPGVLITDIAGDRTTVNRMMAKLKELLPELVAVVVSEHRDVEDMVWLINHGQVFRFLRKPVSSGRCAVSIKAALQHHHNLRQRPQLAARHQVSPQDANGVWDTMVERIKTVRKRWASA